MSKAGDKIKRGLEEALAVAQGDLDEISKIRVTPSCGCVFCDLDVPRYGHYHFGGRKVACQRYESP
jgi:hypothetical protein